MGKRTHVEATISVENTFTDWLQIDKNERFTMSIELPTGTTIITFQRQLARASGLYVVDVEAFNSDSLLTDLEQDGIASESMSVRVGVKTSELNTGTPFVRIGK